MRWLNAFVYSLAVIIFNILLTEVLSWDNWITNYSLILIVSISWGVFLINKYNKIKFWSFKFLFLVFVIVFHFGQLFLYVINYDFGDMTNFILKFSMNTLINTLTFSYLVICSLLLGMLFSGTNKKNNINVNTEPEDYRLLKIIAWTFILLFFPFNLYTNFQSISQTLTAGYTTLNLVEFSALSDIGYLSYTGFVLLLLIYPKDSLKFNVLMLSLLTYLGITMMSGGRGMSIIIIGLVLYIFFNKTGKKINLFKSIMFIIIFYLLAALLNSIADVRILNNISMPLFMKIFSENLTKNPIFELIAEMGATIQTPMLIFEQIPNLNNYGFGRTFLNSWVTIFPNINDVFQEIINSVNYMLNVKGTALGGSLIGELYYNFGKFGFIFAFIIGILVAKISDAMDKTLKSKDYLTFALYVPIFIIGLWWTRSNFSSIIRLTVWNAVILILLKVMLSKIFVKNEKYN